MPIDTFYRFRPVENLLGEFQELDKQSIFFAPPHLLNDPVEGFKDIYWEGDEILWRNLFDKYLLCLFDGVLEFKLNAEKADIQKTINAANSPEQLSDYYRPIFQSISDDFLGNQQINEMIAGISEYRTKVSRSELSFYLQAVHSFALNCISENYKGIDVTGTNDDSDGSSYLEVFRGTEFFKQVWQLEDEYGEAEVRGFLSQLTFSLGQMSFMAHQKGINSKAESQLKGKFTEIFLGKLEELTFPDWFTACFMTECENSSVWGNYGNNHTGVCLVFNTEVDQQGNSNLSLSADIIGVDTAQMSSFKFHKIDYEHQYEPINFFDSLGRLPIGQANDSWFSWNGEYSDKATTYSEDWRRGYWDNFYKSVTRKTKDWAYEMEHRLLISDPRNSFPEKGVTFHYDFKFLKGIIFGIKTTDENKHKIIEIVERKVKENEHYDFKFYQAYYCRDDGKIKHYEMTSLKFKQPEVEA
ncbi:hypothetical protein A1OQ_16245 [Enterovibrio norvegicus FF-162]|uniref:DUF2971 domain-containing protein n=1 Tax=Enterovibrio norvegicus TaxID=188144 RepID=UPI00030BBA01|nr:DUF2971 domain-containing protein [Enterovibrio norvegicus]OEE86957.1 hypothetical protein A1OQ_16245 [Enterovibrio norvegicus FF-162]